MTFKDDDLIDMDPTDRADAKNRIISVNMRSIRMSTREVCLEESTRDKIHTMFEDHFGKHIASTLEGKPPKDWPDDKSAGTPFCLARIFPRMGEAEVDTCEASVQLWSNLKTSIAQALQSEEWTHLGSVSLSSKEALAVLMQPLVVEALTKPGEYPTALVYKLASGILGRIVEAASTMEMGPTLPSIIKTWRMAERSEPTTIKFTVDSAQLPDHRKYHIYTPSATGSHSDLIASKMAYTCWADGEPVT